MESKQRRKMTPAERAKQFMPFAAVKGLAEALAAKERELGLEPKKELSEEMAALINQKLLSLTPGEMVTVTYFQEGIYLTATGAVVSLSRERELLTVEELTIDFGDIFDIRRTQENEAFF